jgi:DNA repair exonuclease SbcCD ATPase subunit
MRHGAGTLTSSFRKPYSSTEFRPATETTNNRFAQQFQKAPSAVARGAESVKVDKNEKSTHHPGVADGPGRCLNRPWPSSIAMWIAMGMSFLPTTSTRSRWTSGIESNPMKHPKPIRTRPSKKVRRIIRPRSRRRRKSRRLKQERARLTEVESTLNQEFEALTKERDNLDEEMKNAVTTEQIKAYNQKIADFNSRIQSYEEKRNTYSDHVEAFNKRAAALPSESN